MSIEALITDIHSSLDLLWFWQGQPDRYVTCELLAEGKEWLIIIHNSNHPFHHQQTAKTHDPIAWLTNYANRLNDQIMWEINYNPITDM